MGSQGKRNEGVGTKLKYSSSIVQLVTITNIVVFHTMACNGTVSGSAELLILYAVQTN